MTYRVPHDSYEWLESLPAPGTINNKQRRVEIMSSASVEPSHSVSLNARSGRVAVEIGRVRAPWLRGPYRRVPRGERRLLAVLLVGAAVVAVRIAVGLIS